MKSFCLLVLLYGSYIGLTNVYGFDCPAVTASLNCTLDPLCSVCNEQTTPMIGTYYGCSQCNGNYFLYTINQCLHCQDTFGNECLHCTDGGGCQQCADGYQIVQDMNCNGIRYCEVIPDPVGCDDKCIQCQNEHDPLNAYCTQCKNSKWFLGDATGKNGCLKCKREFGEECLHCANIQGCQQCATGFNRVQDPNTLLHYCECATDCSEIITFEELIGDLNIGGGIAGRIPNGYFNLDWNATNPEGHGVVWSHLIYANFFPLPGSLDLNNTAADPSYGQISYLGLEHSMLGVGYFSMGSSGGTQFKLVRFDAASVFGNEGDVSCDGYLNGNQAFSMSPAGTINAFDGNNPSTDTITINNNIIIDYVECFLTDDLLVIDNIEVIFI